MNDRETYKALVLWHLSLGYSLNASIRLTRWCLNPEAGMYPEKSCKT